MFSIIMFPSYTLHFFFFFLLLSFTLSPPLSKFVRGRNPVKKTLAFLFPTLFFLFLFFSFSFPVLGFNLIGGGEGGGGEGECMGRRAFSDYEKKNHPFYCFKKLPIYQIIFKNSIRIHSILC